MSLPKAGYRPDIDGLRAVSILGVIMFHLNPSILPGGFLGVDVFFVISGFLISGIIQRGLERGDFSFLNFYERRIKRLMPALFVLIAVISIPAVIWMWPSDLKDYARSVKAVVIPTANIHFLEILGDYFNKGADELPLLHAWSLAVEEQFYLVFPGVLFLLNRFFKRSYVLGFLWVLFVVSLVACYWRGVSSPMTCFFLLPYRAWELLAGALLAFHWPRSLNARLASVEGWCGLVMVIGSFALVSGQNLVPGLSAIPACVGAVLLMHSGAGSVNFPSRILSTKLMVGLGLISYSAYLWHWPIIVMGQWLFGEIGLFDGAVFFCLSIFLGWASWKFVEQPFRGKGFPDRRKVFVGWAVVTLVFIFAGQFTRNARGFPGRFPQEVSDILSFEKKEERFTIRTKEHYDPAKAPVFGDLSVAPSIAVWGDSHAEALLPVLDEMALERNVAFKIYSSPGQIPVPGMIRDQEDNELRKSYANRVFGILKSDEKIKTVVLHARWSTAIWGEKEGGEELLQRFHGREFKTRSEVMDAYEKGMREVVSGLLDAGKRVVVVYPVPELSANIPRFLAQEKHAGKPLSETIECQDFLDRNRDVINWFDRLPDRDGLIRIKPHRIMLEQGRVKISSEGKPLYRDSHHLSSAGAGYIEDVLVPVFGDDS